MDGSDVLIVLGRALSRVHRKRSVHVLSERAASRAEPLVMDERRQARHGRNPVTFGDV
jgi:hypothetical protein